MTSFGAVSIAALGATGLLTVAMAGPAACSEQGTLEVTRTYPANSPAVAQVHRWLLAQPSARYRPPERAAELGQLRTSYLTHAVGAEGRTDLTSTEVAFPVVGRSGDEVVIDACGAGTRHRWTYRWMASAPAGWQLQAYRLKEVPDCDAAMADPAFL